MTGTTAVRASGFTISTSFSSKSELALNLSTDGSALTLMGYSAAPNLLDVSNANTRAVHNSSNPVSSTFARAIGTITSSGISVTNVNAYSGKNGRAALLGNGNYYLVGNAGNSGKSVTNATLDALSANTGVQMIARGNSGNTTVVGRQICPSCVGTVTGNQYGFSIAPTYSATADKTGKDDNFRGATIFNNTLYVTKGSGSNGMNSVYQVGANGSLPTAGTASTTDITILPGFNTVVGSSTTNPFGLWFANSTTLYVADEGDGKIGDADSFAGLQKWSLVNGSWKLDYTLKSGLNIGLNYTVQGSLNADGSINPNGTGLSSTTSTVGLRNLVGKIGDNGAVMLYAITAAASSATDTGADPNRLIEITDSLGYTTAAQAAGESFSTLQTASYGEVVRGVSVAPVPLPGAVWLLGSGFGGIAALTRRRRNKVVAAENIFS